MGFRKESKCKRCGCTTVYTNAVEFTLWSERPGCPACTKVHSREQDDGSDEMPVPDTSQGVAALCGWMVAEREAVVQLRSLGVITSDEADALDHEITTAVRTMLGLKPL